MPQLQRARTPARDAGHGEGFVHEALVYRGLDGFTSSVAPFIREGVERDEPVLVVVPTEKIERLRDELGADARPVRFVDMEVAGRNPAWIIPAWRKFVAANPGRPFRGVGEPIWAGRSPSELVECHIHESLLNVAFDRGPAWRLLCPYDASALPDDVIADAERNHPVVVRDGERAPSATYARPLGIEPLRAPLPAPPPDAERLGFELDSLTTVRRFAVERALAAGLRQERATDAVIAVNEVATNSTRYGGGRGTLRAWRENGTVLFEVEDGGTIDDPLVGREAAPPDRPGGRGLWMANRLCDLVQIRTTDGRTLVRLHLRTES